MKKALMTLGLAVLLAAPAMAGSVGVYGAWFTTEDASDSLGVGGWVDFYLGKGVELELRGSHFSDFETENDVGDRADTRAGLRVTGWGLVVNALLIVIKGAGGIFGRSQALIASSSAARVSLSVVWSRSTRLSCTRARAVDFRTLTIAASTFASWFSICASTPSTHSSRTNRFLCVASASRTR